MHGAYVGSSGTSVLYIGCMVPKGERMQLYEDMGGRQILGRLEEILKQVWKETRQDRRNKKRKIKGQIP